MGLRKPKSKDKFLSYRKHPIQFALFVLGTASTIVGAWLIRSATMLGSFTRNQFMRGQFSQMKQHITPPQVFNFQVPPNATITGIQIASSPHSFVHPAQAHRLMSFAQHGGMIFHPQGLNGIMRLGFGFMALAIIVFFGILLYNLFD